MSLSIRAPVDDRADDFLSPTSIEDGGYVEMAEALRGWAGAVVAAVTTPMMPMEETTPETELVPRTPNPDDLRLPTSPPVLYRQRAIVGDEPEADFLLRFPDVPIRVLFGTPVPHGAPIEHPGAEEVNPNPFGPAPEVPSEFFLEPTDRNNPTNYNRFAAWFDSRSPWF